MNINHMTPELILKHADRVIKVFRDPEPFDPREEEDMNVGTIIHWHRRYDFGTHMSDRITDEKEMRAYLTEQGHEVLAILPLYLFDHSGVSLSNTPFSCTFDSGQVGWIYVTAASAAALGLPLQEKSKYEEYLKDETKTYDKYLNGDVYGYVVYNKENHELDSCWGYYDINQCMAEGKTATEYVTDPWVEAQVAEMAARITYASV